jgi:hypothetical protein
MFLSHYRNTYTESRIKNLRLVEESFAFSLELIEFLLILKALLCLLWMRDVVGKQLIFPNRPMTASAGFSCLAFALR